MKISASNQVQLWLQSLPPETRSKVRLALKRLAGGSGGDVKSLRGELDGFLRLRVAGYRIIYHLEPGRSIRLDYANARDAVYQAFIQLRRLSGD